MREEVLFSNECLMKRGVVNGYRLASLCGHSLKTDYDKERFLSRHILHSVHDRDFMFDAVLRHGYAAPDADLYSPSLRDASTLPLEHVTVETIFGLGRALYIIESFSAGKSAGLNGCEPIYLCPSHSFFFKYLAFKKALSFFDKTFVYVPSLLPDSDFFKKVHEHFWLPYMEFVRDAVLQDLQRVGGSKAPQKYKDFGFDFDPHNAANFLTRFLFICQPRSETFIAFRLDESGFNKVFLRKFLSLDPEEVCPITLVPVGELRPVSHCPHCYSKFERAAFALCRLCPVCRTQMR